MAGEVVPEPGSEPALERKELLHLQMECYSTAAERQERKELLHLQMECYSTAAERKEQKEQTVPAHVLDSQRSCFVAREALDWEQTEQTEQTVWMVLAAQPGWARAHAPRV